MHLKTQLAVFLFIWCIGSIKASHYRGGTITWRALNTTPSGSTAEILIRQRHSWRRTFFSPRCDDTRIANYQVIGTGTGWLACYAGGSCSSYTQIRADVICTDYSNSSDLDYSLGERLNTTTLPLTRTFVLGFRGNAWMALAIRGNSWWQITGKIELSTRPDGILNTSPVTTTLPVIYKTINVQHVHVIQMSDADSTDVLRCRWSTNGSNPTTNWNGYDECGSVCSPTLPTGFTLFGDNCTLVFNITALNYYAVALQIEDFYTSSSTTPMSSVPIQFLFLGKSPPTGCSVPPIITGLHRHLACRSKSIGTLTNETVVAEVSCPGKRIIEFVTSSPIGLRKSSILNPSTGVYMITLLWTPTADQYGLQIFCAAAIDDTGVQSPQWCITFLVDFASPNLLRPSFAHGLASPLGTILSHDSVFSIQSANGVAVNRPSRGGNYIRFHDETLNGTTVLAFDCANSTNVIYCGSTIFIITAPFVWAYGHSYYITFDSGVSSDADICRTESDPLKDPSFWRFNITNPGFSTTTTTISTTVTVTTQVTSTTTTSTPATTTRRTTIASSSATSKLNPSIFMILFSLMRKLKIF